MDAEKKLGALQPIVGTDSDSLTVKLQPLGSVSGETRRDEKGPFGKLHVTAIPNLPDAEKYENIPFETLKYQGTFGMRRGPWWNLTKRTTTTDDKGHFQIDGLMPGLDYTIYVSDGDLGEPDTLVTSKAKVKVEWGKNTDVGVLEKAKG
jgi:hypothetical protein